MKIVFLGLSITSSWGNGHATTYRALLKELARRGHQLVFFERDQAWYAGNRDRQNLPYCRIVLYKNLSDLRRYTAEVAAADCVVVGSYVPEGVVVGEWVLQIARGLTAFYDIDTPVTLQNLARGACDYLLPRQIPRYGLYLSFTGGPTLQMLEQTFGSPNARALYCSVDADLYYPETVGTKWDLGYLGTYSADRQEKLESRLLKVAAASPEGRFVVAGPQYPATVQWPANVERIEHLSPAFHRHFYNQQRFTLNLTRADMAGAGWSPSVRLFEAAACAVPIISDPWDGLEEFFVPGLEILIARSRKEVCDILQGMSEAERRQIGERARRRVLLHHTAAERAREFEAIVESRRLGREPASEAPEASASCSRPQPFIQPSSQPRQNQNPQSPNPVFPRLL